MYSGSLLTGTIGTTTVDPVTGLFALTVRPPPPGPPGTRVNVLSSRGGQLLNLPITRFRLEESGDALIELDPVFNPSGSPVRNLPAGLPLGAGGLAATVRPET